MKLSDNTIEHIPIGIKRTTLFDLTLLTLFNIFMLIVFTQFDVSELIIDQLHRYETFELDEVIPLFLTIIISAFIFTIRRFLELKELFIKIEQVSIRDHLTGLYNRRCMQDKFKNVVERSKKRSKNYSVFIIDIDDFKTVNDRFGHNTGDIILAQFSQTILASTREFDIVSRWGGEEFLVLCPHTNINEATMAAKRILAAIRNYNFDIVGHMTASMGGRCCRRK